VDQVTGTQQPAKGPFVIRYLEELIVGALFVVMTVSATLQVFFRYILNSGIPWAEELSRFSFIWITFLGASMVLKYDGHISVDTIVRVFPASVRRTAAVVVYVASMCLLGLLVWYGTKLSISAWDTPTSILGWPWGLIYSAVPLGSALAIIRLTVRTWPTLWVHPSGAGGK